MKMKKSRLGIIMAVFIFIAMLLPQAIAANNKKPLRVQVGQYALIEAKLSQANGEKISSLQLAIEVTSQDGTSENKAILETVKNLSFSPDPAITSKAKICEQRYHENTGVLDIYIAGTQPLFSEQDKLTVGTVTATGKDGNGVDVYIKMVTDSFKVVRGNSLQTIMEDDADIRLAAVQEEPSTKPQEPETPTTPQKPEEPTTPQETETPTTPQKPEEPSTKPQEPETPTTPQKPEEPSTKPQEPETPTTPQKPEEPTTPQNPEIPTTPQNPEVPTSQDPVMNKSKLNEALDIASGFVSSDYTTDSFAQLKIAIEKAKMVANNSDATQEEIESATEELLNVIGSLVPALKNSVESNSQTDNNEQNQNSVAQTGDWNGVWIFTGMTIFSLAVIVMLVVWKKYHKKLEK